MERMVNEMPRPEMWDREKKLIAYETGYRPVSIQERQRDKKKHLIITFGTEVSPNELDELHEKLRTCFYFTYELKIEGETT